MFRCEGCQMRFDSTDLLHRHEERFCDVRQNIGSWLGEVEEPPSDLMLEKVVELRELKDKKAKWRQERAIDDRFLLDKLASTHKLDREEIKRQRRQEKDREREVRYEVQQEQYNRVKTQISSQNEVLHSLNKDLEEKMRRVENARIRKAIGAPPANSMPVYSPEISGIQEKIDVIEETFSSVKSRLYYMGGCEPTVEEPESDFTSDSMDLPELDAEGSNGIRASLDDGRQSDGGSDQMRVHEYEDKGRVNMMRELLETQTSPTEDHPTDLVSDRWKHLVKITKTGRPAAEQSSRRPAESGGPSVLTEIRKVRESYLRQGGSNPDVLARISQLEHSVVPVGDTDIHRSNDNMRRVTNQLAVLEEENSSLNEQLQLLQGHRVDDLSLGLTRPQALVTKQREYELQWTELKEELELLRQQVALQKLQREADVHDYGGRWSPHRRPPDKRAPLQALTSYVDKEWTFDPDTTVVPLVVEPSPGLKSSVKSLEFDDMPTAPYDPKAGFEIFYDFVVGLKPTSQACGLVASLYTEESQYGEPGSLPTVLCETAPPLGSTSHHKMAMVAARQPVVRCMPSENMSLVVEVQISDSHSASEGQVGEGTPGQQGTPDPCTPGPLTAMGWCKVDLFDKALHLLSGWWRIAIRELPTLPNLPMSHLNTVPQYGQAELLLRLVNHRNVADQSEVPLDILRLFPMYRNMNQELRFHEGSLEKTLGGSMVASQQKITASTHQTQVVNMGVQIVHTKYMPPGEARLRITVYDTSTGQVVQCASGPVNYDTTTSKMSFRYHYFIFGHQEAVFKDLVLNSDLVLVVRLYLRIDKQPNAQKSKNSAGTSEREKLVAWTAMNLVRYSSIDTSSSGSKSSVPKGHLVEGKHTLQLYRAPVPSTLNLPKSIASPSNKPYGKAFVKILMFHVDQRPGSLTPSDISSDEDSEQLDQPWLSFEPRQRVQNESFEPGQGFDVYIDGCRFLPDGVTITRVAGRILDRQFRKVGQDISATVDPESDMYNPRFRYRLEIRDVQVPSTATLLLKVYTVNEWTKKLETLGHTTLNIFTILGSTKQPSSDSLVQVALNAGGHQLRLYSEGPTGLEPLTGICLQDMGIRYIPCATLLVRIVKAPLGPDRVPLESSKVPPSDWQRLGLWVAPPDYNKRHYQSMSCAPSDGEVNIYHSQARRPQALVKDSLHLLVSGPELRALKTDKSIQTFIKSHLTKLLEAPPGVYDLTFISRYSPKHGIMVALDGAANLPWPGLTHASICLNPPGALYKGPPQAMYDLPEFTRELALDTTNQNPQWTDGYKPFPYRSYHPHLTVIVHLHEIVITVDARGYKYNLMEQGWTAIPVFSGTYAVTAAYQMPLFEGSPTEGVLAQLAMSPYDEWRHAGLAKKTLQLMPGASVWVRVVDGRRMDEIPHSLNQRARPKVEVDESYLPDFAKQSYIPSDAEGTKLRDLIPAGKALSSFNRKFAAKFKSLVYRLYNAGRL